MTDLLLFGKSFPAILYLLWLFSPLFTDELGNLGVGESRMPSGDLALVMLPVKNECYSKRKSTKGVSPSLLLNLNSFEHVHYKLNRDKKI